MLLCSIAVNAHDFEVDGFYYNFINSGTVEVTYQGSNYYSEAYSGDIVIPSSVTYNGNTYIVTRIGEHAFYQSKGMTSLTVPASIESIGENAFGPNLSNFKTLCIEDSETALTMSNSSIYSNSSGLLSYVNLETLYLGRNLTYSSSPFYINKKIKNVTIGEMVTELGSRLFSGCTGIVDLTIPENVVSIGYAAFQGCTGLKDIEISSSISVISECMFEGCTGLASITIPSNITTVSIGAFKGCTGLNSIVVPATVTKIQAGVFEGCTVLESIAVDGENTVYDSRENCNAIIETATNRLLITCKNTIIPGSVIAFGDYAFAGNTNIVDFTIPDGIKTIGNYAFSGCTKLKSIKIPETITEIGVGAFEGCTMLANIELPGGMTHIPASMFSECISLENVTIPAGVTQIDGGAFYGCKMLANITLPANLTEIGSGAFSGCTALVEVTSKAFMAPKATDAFDRDRNKTLNIPDGADYLEWVRYFQIPDYDYACSYRYWYDEIPQIEWFYKDGNVVVYGTGVIDGNPFYEKEIKSIVFEGDFSSISNCGNGSLRHIELPKNLVTIDDNAFHGSPLDFVVIPATVTEIGDYAFGNTTLIFKSFSAPTIGEMYGGNLCIPEGANNYPTGLFGGVSYYYSQQECAVKYDDTEGKYKLYIFGNTDALDENSIIDNYYSINEFETITFASDATGYNIISRLPNLKSVNVTNAFPVNGKLYTVEGSNAVLRDRTLVAGCAVTVIPQGVEEIADNAFNRCTGLKEIEIPSSVKRIGYGAFSGCGGLNDFEIPTSVNEISSNAFAGCSSLTKITVPGNVTVLQRGAFEYCTGLRDVVLNAGIVVDDAFRDCRNLEKLTIGKDVTTMGYNCFTGCSSLANITVDPENGVYDSRNNSNSIIETATDKLRLATRNSVIPETVTAIGSNAYAACADMDLTVPASVVTIDNYAFQSLNRLYFESEVPATISGNIFGWGAIYVPSAAYEAYCNADVWRDYVEQIVTPELANVCVNSKSSDGVSGVFNAFEDSRLIRRVVNLKVTGCINSYDIILFRDKMPYLSELDLSEATVIASSKPFYQTYCTGNNSLGSNAFYDLDRLVSVKLPKDLSVLGNKAFQSCGKLVSVDASATAELNIGNRAFMGCSNLKEFVSPARISEIGDSAFFSCTQLETVEMKEISGSIGKFAFTECEKLSIADLGNIGGDIRTNAFCNSNIKKLNIGYVGGNIYDKAFDKSLVETVRIEAMDGNLENRAFEGCVSLKSVEFGRGPARIGSKVFFESDSLVSFIAGDGTLEVADDAFGAFYTIWNGAVKIENETYRTKLEKVVLPASVQKIGEKAFRACSSLSDFTMPESVTSIGKNAFMYCYSLPSVNLPAGLTEIPEYAFYACGFKDITFSENLTTIGKSAFGSCRINSLKLPPRLKTISEGAFQYCSSLTELHIPSSVEYIGSYAFSSCNQLNDIYTYTVEPTIITETTFSTFASARLYIPETSFQYYYWDIGWSRFNEDRYQKFSEVYDYFYLNNDYVLDENTGYIEGTPDADMHPGSGLIVSGDDNGSEGPKQNLGNVNLEDDGEGNSAAIIGDQNLHIDNLHVRINVKGGRWYFFAFPWDVPLDKISMDNGSDYVFRYYDGEERAQKGNGGWKDVKEKHLKAARGYIFQSSGNDVLVLSIEDVKFKKEDKYNELVTHVSENLNDASWNLMGNPYLSYYDLADMDYTAPVTVWDGEKYVAIRPGDDDYQFTPYEAFFVQKPEGEESVTFSADGQMTKTQAETDKLQKAAARRVRGIDPQRLLVNMVLSNDITEDRTRVVFNERTTHNYETACDAAKFETAGIPQLYTIDNEGVRYAINERPVGNGVVLIGYTAPAPGYYTIDAPRMDTKVYLYDAQTGEKHHFDEDGEYSFYSEAGTFERRFSLGVRGDDTTGIEEMEDDMEQSADERAKSQTIYDLQGRKHQRSHKGIYIINGEKVVK